jgi:hypothetical protein
MTNYQSNFTVTPQSIKNLGEVSLEGREKPKMFQIGSLGSSGGGEEDCVVLIVRIL